MFQNNEGVDVCVFAMYIQEFGSNYREPNSSCVYVSHLDSVNYFIPEKKIVAGDSLRTFVYHEILVIFVSPTTLFLLLSILQLKLLTRHVNWLGYFFYMMLSQIRYLDYWTNHGFTNCYIWACPPQQGDEYIFYCHPNEQMTPNQNKLCNWYISFFSFFLPIALSFSYVVL